jgi:hypothetical protein
MKSREYQNLLTRSFLKREYLKNKKSISQLQDELKIDWNTIKGYLKFYNINLRTHKEQASISSPGGKFLYGKLFTKSFLVKKYVKNKKGIVDLAKELKVDEGTIRRYLHKYKIEIRKSKEQVLINNPPKIFELSREAISFIDGLLLGDASIPKRKDGTKPRALTQACKHKEYLEYVKKRLLNFRIESSPILSRWIKDDRCRNKGYNQHFLQSRRYKTFELFRERWYPKGVKIVPKNILITRDLLIQAYLCDGNFYREVRFCTDGFDKESVFFLKKLIEKELRIALNTRTNNGNYEIFIKKSDSAKFLSYLGKCPVKCYGYKWQDNESEEAKERKRLKAREKYREKQNADFCGTIPQSNSRPL